MKILTTGASGFVGRELCQRLTREGYEVVRALRMADGVPGIVVGDIDADTDWRAALKEVDAVIHLAARVHIMHEKGTGAAQAYRKVNVDGTLNLARQAAELGVKRFIYLSSIKVNGESTPCGEPFREDDRPAPADPYGISKLEAEIGLFELSKATGLEVVIVRPPLVYGPGVKANFHALMRLVSRGFILPLGRIHNLRSLIALDNLVDLLHLCITHPKAKNEIFLAADGEDLSTPELIRRIGRALEKQARLMPFPCVILRLLARLVNQGPAVERLCGSLQIDISKARRLLGWTPPLSVEEGLLKTARSFSEDLPG